MNFEEYLSSLQNKTVAVIGIGVSNKPLVELLLSRGIAVTACDRKSREVLGSLADDLESQGARLRLGDGYLADLTEDLAAEQKARVTYDNILRLSDDPDVNDAIKFLREREIIHFQRFGEAADLLRRKLHQKNIYAVNPAIDL